MRNAACDHAHHAWETIFGEFWMKVAFRPRLAETLKHYSREDLFADLVAGITVGIVALPMAMTFGIAYGVMLEAGFLTAVVTGFIISAFVGSRFTISD